MIPSSSASCSSYAESGYWERIIVAPSALARVISASCAAGLSAEPAVGESSTSPTPRTCSGW